MKARQNVVARIPKWRGEKLIFYLVTSFFSSDSSFFSQKIAKKLCVTFKGIILVV
jgi:hypothetical protein